MGGWYDDFCPGAHFGQYVSALAGFAAVTGSEPTRVKVKRLVGGYAQTLDDTGKFFVDLRYPRYTTSWPAAFSMLTLWPATRPQCRSCTQPHGRRNHTWALALTIAKC